MRTSLLYSLLAIFLDPTTMNTPNNISGLPNASGLNVDNLSKLFDNTTNSYKYIFFLSLLDILSSRFFDSSKPILLRDILIEMLANSWYPYVFGSDE